MKMIFRRRRKNEASPEMGAGPVLKNKLISDVTVTTTVFFLNRSISFLRGFVVARLLNPSLYGYFSGLSLIFLYNAQGHLGILHGLNRSLSIARGEKNDGAYESVKNNAITAIAILSVLISAGIILFSILKSGEYDSRIIWGMRVYAVVAAMYHFEYLYHSFLRADHRFREINASRMIFAISNLLLVVVLAKMFSFYGVIAALAASMVLEITFLLYRVRLRPRFALDFSLIKHLIATGAPVSFAFLIEMFMNSVDRLMIIKFLDSEQLGYYGIAATFSLELLLRIPEIITYVIYPRILEKYGQTRNAADLLSYFQAPSIMIGCIMAVIIGLMFLSVDFIISTLLPRYTAAIMVTKILVFSTYFLSINQVAVRIIMTINKTRPLLVLQIAAILCNVILNYITISHGYGINGVAVSTGISLFLYSAAITHTALKMISIGFFESVKKQAGLYLPFGYSLLALLLVEQFRTVLVSFPYEILTVFFNIFFFVVMISPMAWYLIRAEELRKFLKACA
ncbi:MAG: oligosaccharide flippase family protein [Desulfobacteraceae bacterium]|nr:oligosaccharide flippase family protein [Desulfobacteraceae bacterium]